MNEDMEDPGRRGSPEAAVAKVWEGTSRKNSDCWATARADWWGFPRPAVPSVRLLGEMPPRWVVRQCFEGINKEAGGGWHRSTVHHRGAREKGGSTAASNNVDEKDGCFSWFI